MTNQDGYYELDSAILTKDSSVVFSKDKLSFEEILSDIEISEYILISTYSLGNADGRLMTLLNALDTFTNIIIVTNVPDYFYLCRKGKKDEATNKLEEYRQRLKPLLERENTTLYFSFRNHGKLIATDRMVYLGSANFSDASAMNDEVGLLIRNCDGMRIGKQYWELIKNSVTPLMTPTLDPMVRKIEELASAFKDRNSSEQEYSELKSDIFWSVVSRVKNLCESLEELQELLDDAEQLPAPYIFFDRNLIVKALKLIDNSEIQKALEFSKDELISKRLTDVSDEEEMDAAHDRAFSLATEEEERLYYNARETMVELWKIVGELAAASVSSIENFD